MNYQKTIVGGRFTHDHELRYTPKGTAVLTNTIAVNRKGKDANGNQQESVTYFDVKAWGITAENLHNYTGKGSPILADMRMENERWEDKATGQPRSKNVFVIETFSFAEAAADAAKRGEGRQRPQGQPPAGQGQQQPPQGGQRGFADGAGGSSGALGFDEDDDIPF
jgi:single-strand DNA-binding protein